MVRGAHFENFLVRLSWLKHILYSRRASSAQLGCSSKLSRQARQKLRVDWVCPILKKYIFGILMKSCTTYVSAISIGQKNSKWAPLIFNQIITVYSSRHLEDILKGRVDSMIKIRFTLFQNELKHDKKFSKLLF